MWASEAPPFLSRAAFAAVGDGDSSAASRSLSGMRCSVPGLASGEGVAASGEVCRRKRRDGRDARQEAALCVHVLLCDRLEVAEPLAECGALVRLIRRRRRRERERPQRRGGIVEARERRGRVRRSEQAMMMAPPTISWKLPAAVWRLALSKHLLKSRIKNGASIRCCSSPPLLARHLLRRRPTRAPRGHLHHLLRQGHRRWRRLLVQGRLCNRRNW